MQTHKNTDPHLSPQHKTLTHIYLLQPRTIHTHISFTCYCTVLYTYVRTYELYCTVLCCITVCTYCTVLQEHPCVITVCTYVLYCTVLHTYVRTYALYKQLSTYVYCREVRTRLPELAEYRSWPSTYVPKCISYRSWRVRLTPWPQKKVLRRRSHVSASTSELRPPCSNRQVLCLA